MISSPATVPPLAGGRARLRVVACEAAAVYAPDPVAVLQAGLDGLVGGSLDELDEATIETTIAVAETAKRRLEVWMARATSVLADRHARRAATANPDRAVRAGERARRQRRNELAQRNGWSPGQANDNERLGRLLEQSPTLAAAADDGAISSQNTLKLGRFLRTLDLEDRAKVEPGLLEAARTQDPVTLTRTIDRIRGELSPADAVKAETRRHASRRASVSDTPDGMTRLFAEHAGVDGAIVKRAIDTYRRPDTPGELRKPEQRTADAIVDMARASLQGGTPAKTHGVKPHIVVTVPIDVLLQHAGMVDVDGSPVPLEAIRHLMDDAGWAFVVTATNTRPLAVTGESRTVPAGLWRTLVARDGGCIAEGCDHKADWCDVMHLDIPYRHGGGLSPETAALGCRFDHRAYDAGRLELHWQDGKPVLRPTQRSRDTRAGPSP